MLRTDNVKRISSGTTDYPFVIDKRMNTLVWNEFSRLSPEECATTIHAWMRTTIRYGVSRRQNENYRNSIEVFYDGEGVCGEQAILYITLARAAGIPANYTIVKRNCNGSRTLHACSAVDLEGELFLVDTVYTHPFINHAKYYVLTDQQFFERFYTYRGSGPRGRSYGRYDPQTGERIARSPHNHAFTKGFTREAEDLIRNLEATVDRTFRVRR